MAQALRRTGDRICIATPFLSYSVAEHLIRAADEGRASTQRLIVAPNDSAVAGGYLSITAIEEPRLTWQSQAIVAAAAANRQRPRLWGTVRRPHPPGG
jgi:hypothetical protein